jgi:3-oxoacyl-(acyl-carrier-protein) synthase
MNDLLISATSQVTAEVVKAARLGTRFGRLDLLSQLALLAVESLGIPFDTLPRERIGICLVAQTGSLSTDTEYWQGRDAVGGLSPTLFAYTLPSAAVGEIAIRYGLKGPNLCFIGARNILQSEAEDMIARGEADGCVCVFCNVLSRNAAEVLKAPPSGEARAFFVNRRVLNVHRA